MEKAINSLVPKGLRQKKKKKQRSKGRGKDRECREKLVTEEGMTAHKRPPKKKMRPNFFCFQLNLAK